MKFPSLRISAVRVALCVAWLGAAAACSSPRSPGVILSGSGGIGAGISGGTGGTSPSGGVAGREGVGLPSGNGGASGSGMDAAVVHDAGDAGHRDAGGDAAPAEGGHDASILDGGRDAGSHDGGHDAAETNPDSDGGSTSIDCSLASECPATGNACVVAICVGHVCGTMNVADGTPTTAQTMGDCKRSQCDGLGAAHGVPDDLDSDDRNPCTTDTCSNGTPSHTPVQSGTACGTSGVCDGAGQCMGCSAPSDCPGTDTDCQMRTCLAGVCGVSFASDGTTTSSQTSGDCQRNQCDGSGHVVAVNDDGDLPADDGNQCTGEACNDGVPSHPNRTSASECSQDGGKVCDGDGQCVACNVDAQCGTSTECKTFSCSAHACSSTNAHAGTVVTDQTKGDCHQNQCDGSGGVTAAVDDSDAPDDGNTCTNDVCTNGVASHPPRPIGYSCSQDGGVICDGSGTCIGATCGNHVQDGLETDVDCGGNCSPCASGASCFLNGDCKSGLCSAGSCEDRLLISEVQTRGSAGANDEFVEIYNPTGVPVTFDSSWTLAARSAVTCAPGSYGVRFTGAGQVIPPHGHILFTNGTAVAYDGVTTGDAVYTTGIPDAASVVLFHGTGAADALCFYYDVATAITLATCGGYQCEGLAVSNLPHDSTSAGNLDQSLERKPGGAAGNGQDTNDNSTDFTSAVTSNPQNLSSAPAP